MRERLAGDDRAAAGDLPPERRSEVSEDQVAEPGRAREGVLTLVCFKCGTEYYFAEGEPPSGLVCEKCHNTVFRGFDSNEPGDEVDVDFRESTERDLRPDDAEGDAMPGDVMELDPD